MIYIWKSVCSKGNCMSANQGIYNLKEGIFHLCPSTGPWNVTLTSLLADNFIRTKIKTRFLNKLIKKSNVFQSHSSDYISECQSILRIFLLLKKMSAYLRVLFSSMLLKLASHWFPLAHLVFNLRIFRIVQ